MSTRFIRLYIDKELEGVANKVLKSAEYCVWIKIKLVAGKTLQREGFLEWVKGMPLSVDEIASKIREKRRLVNTTIEKCLKNNLLENLEGTLHVVGWETDQLSQTQRASTHMNVENGKKYADYTRGKPQNRDLFKG